MRLARHADRGQSHQIGIQVGGVVVGDSGERRVRKDREKVLVMLADAFAKRALELGLAPVADAVLLVRGDVGRAKGAERRVESESARRRRVRRAAGVAACAVARLEQILAARDRRRVGRLGRGRRTGESGEQDPT